MRGKYTGGDRVFRSLLFITMFIFGLSFIAILLWVITGSMRSSANFSKNPFGIFDITFESIAKNYEKAFTYKVGGATDMFRMILNSAIIVTGTTALAVIVPAITGYIVAKYDFKLRKILTDLAVITLVVPTVGSVATTYRFMNALHLIDTYSGVFLLSAGGFGFSYLIFRNYFTAIPWEYAEAAFLDGAGNVQVFIRIMLPQAVPIIVSIAIVSFIGNWNDYYTPYLYLREHPTVAYGVNAIYSKYKTNYPVVFAAMTFSVGVVLIIYLFFSKTIMESMSAGGLKG